MKADPRSAHEDYQAYRGLLLCLGPADRMKPLDRRRSLRIAGGTAGLLGLGVTAVRFAGVSLQAVVYLSVSAAVCAIAAGAVAIVRIVANRSPEVRRMAALQRLARKASSPEERLSVLAMLSLASNTSRINRKDTFELIRIALKQPRNRTDLSDSPQASEL
jgi:hypothetical protein